MRYWNLPISTANETITNLTQYELFQEESDLLRAGLYFSIQPDKVWKNEIFTTFEEIHRLFLNNLKSVETKSQIKAHLSFLVNSYFYNYKPSPHILRQNCVLWNLRKNKGLVVTKPDKGNGVVILDRILHNNAIKEIISDTSMNTTPWNVKLHYNAFYVSWNKKTFLMKLNMIIVSFWFCSCSYLWYS